MYRDCMASIHLAATVYYLTQAIRTLVLGVCLEVLV